MLVNSFFAKIRNEFFIKDDFDRIHGTDTSRHISRWRLGIGRTAIHYQATEPDVFAQACQALPSNARSFPFFDLGCGKGRVLIMAQEQGFQHIIGVELSRKALNICRQNLLRLGASTISLIAGSASDVTFPDSPIVVFMYNPFRPPLFNVVLARLEEHGYPLFLIYANPEYRRLIEETGRFVAILDSPNLLVCQLANRNTDTRKGVGTLHRYRSNKFGA